MKEKGKPTWMGETWWGERRWTAVVVVVDCCSSGFLSLLCLRSRLLSEPDAPVPPASPVDGDLVECFRRNELPKLLSRLSWRLWCRLPLHKGHTITTEISFFFYCSQVSFNPMRSIHHPFWKWNTLARLCKNLAGPTNMDCVVPSFFFFLMLSDLELALVIFHGMISQVDFLHKGILAGWLIFQYGDRRAHKIILILKKRKNSVAEFLFMSKIFDELVQPPQASI